MAFVVKMRRLRRRSFGKYQILSSTFMASESPLTRKLDLGEIEEGRSSKRARIDESLTEEIPLVVVQEGEQDDNSESILPPSHVLLGTSPPSLAPDGSIYKILETDVGISEYIARDVPQISGIIKQRYFYRQLRHSPAHISSVFT